MEKYQDKSLSPKERAADLLAKLSLDEKMAQVQCYFPRNADVSDFAERFPLGVGEVACLEMRSMKTIDQAIYLQHAIQHAAIEASPHGIPAIFHMEGLCGLLLEGAASFPCGLGRAASFDTALERQVGWTVGRQAAAMGIAHVLAPVLDVSHNPRFGRYGETYGEDPALVSAMGTAYAQGIHDPLGKNLNTESVAKHFAGSHENQAGLHASSADVPSRKLREVYVKPFQAVMDEGGLLGIMPCYNSMDGVPASGSKKLLTGLPREEMGFQGLAVSDYSAIENMMTVQNVCGNKGEAGLLAMEAGMDVELPSAACFGPELQEKFASGEADMTILDQAVLRVLEAKFRMGLFEHPYALQGQEFDRSFYGLHDKDISRRSAQESIVLLKNEGILPIRTAPRRIAVIGWHAGTIRSMFGGYTHLSMAEGLHGDLATMAGISEGGKVQRKAYSCYPGINVTDETPFREDYEKIARTFYPQTKTLFEQIKTAFPDSDVQYAYGYDFTGTDESRFPEALALAEQSDLVILTLGGKHGTGFTCSMGENVDSASINLPPCQEKFIERAAAVCSRLVGIHLDGRPISSNNADKYLSAILEAWSPAEFGAEAICDVLCGRYNPSGKPPVTVAYTAGQTPIHYNHDHNSGYRRDCSNALPGYVECPYSPRYHFGFGPSYTMFQYAGLTIDKTTYAPDEKAIITAQITNTGAWAGTEIVQLYIEDVVASTVRPVMQLEGAARVELASGETKTVRFAVPMSQLALLDRDDRWKIEKGVIRVMVGSSSQAPELTGEFSISADKYLDSGRNRGYFAQAEVLS